MDFDVAAHPVCEPPSRFGGRSAARELRAVEPLRAVGPVRRRAPVRLREPPNPREPPARPPPRAAEPPQPSVPCGAIRPARVLQRRRAFLPHCLDSPAKSVRPERPAAHPSSGGPRYRRSATRDVSSDYARRSLQQDCRDNVAEFGVSAATGAPPRRYRRASGRLPASAAGCGSLLAATSGRRFFPPWAKTFHMETLSFPYHFSELGFCRHARRHRSEGVKKTSIWQVFCPRHRRPLGRARLVQHANPFLSGFRAIKKRTRRFV